MDQTTGTEERHDLWQRLAGDRGFAPDRVVASARNAGRERKRDLSPEASEGLITKRLAAVPDALTQGQSTFEHRQLVACVAGALVGSGAGADRAAAEVKRMVASGMVAPLAQDRRWGHPVYSTPALIALERDLLAIAQRLGAERIEQGAPDDARIADLVQVAGLNPEQAAAAGLAAGSALIAIVEGAPVVGKSTLLAPVAEAWAEAGWRVIGAATAWKVAHGLCNDLGIEARALDSWLAGAELGRPCLSHRTVLLVDEAGLMSSRQLHAMLARVERARAEGAQVVVRLVGDRKQLQPIGGPGLRIVADAIGTQRVDTIVRQRKAWRRDAVMAFGAGRAADALALLEQNEAVVEMTGPKAVVAAKVRAWRDASETGGGQAPLLIARTNTQVLALNRGVAGRRGARF